MCQEHPPLVWATELIESISPHSSEMYIVIADSLQTHNNFPIVKSNRLCRYKFAQKEKLTDILCL